MLAPLLLCWSRIAVAIIAIVVVVVTVVVILEAVVGARMMVAVVGAVLVES